jgi:hypothetical protein
MEHRCRWPLCEKLATGSDGYCDRHAVEYWRQWHERQPDVWVDVTCWKCRTHFSVLVKSGDAKHLWLFKLCGKCERGAQLLMDR